MAFDNSKFNDPEKMKDLSMVCRQAMIDLTFLDVARRCFERTNDRTYVRRAEEIRQYFRQLRKDYINLISTVIPENSPEQAAELASYYHKWRKRDRKRMKRHRSRLTR